MRTNLLTILSGALILSGCGITRIVTVSPDYGTSHSYTTTVTVPKTHTVTTTTQIVTTAPDISLHLNLEAVTAAFCRSSTIREFEDILNNNSYMLSNLDLNGDGYVDYLRVVETMQGRDHIVVIQAVVGYNMYQDVATIVALYKGYRSYRMQVIGSPYLYGPGFYVQPSFYVSPPMFGHLSKSDYRLWISPYGWKHYPSLYRSPKTVYLSHYSAYVRTFMERQRYCAEISYPAVCYYPDYERACHTIMRNDYGLKYPERSFTRRTANIAVQNAHPSNNGNGSQKITVRNAKDVIDQYESSTKSSTSKSVTGRGSSSSSSSSATSAPKPSTSTSRSASSTAKPATPSSGNAAAAKSSSSSSGTSRTGVTTGRGSNTGSNTAASRSSAAQTGRTASSSNANAAGASKSEGQSQNTQTTIKSRVGTSGSVTTRSTTSSGTGSSGSGTTGSAATTRSGSTTTRRH